MRKLLTFIALVMALSITMSATISVPNVFTPFSTISSSQVNTNFSTIASEALDKRGDTMTGTLNTQLVEPDITSSRDLGTVSLLFRNAFFSGTLNAASLVLAGSITGATSGAFSTTLNVTGTTTLGTLNAGATTTGSLSASSFSTSTPVPIASGGTNGTATPTNGGVVAGNGIAYVVSAAGTAGQLLQSAGAGTPTWFGNTTSFAAGNTGAAITLNFVTNGLVQQITRNASTTITLTHPSLASTVMVVMVHDGTSTAYTVAFSPAVKFPSGVAPTFTASAGGIDIMTLFWDGANWYGVLQTAFA